MAIRGRRPREVVHHSDHETQYTSLAFGKRCWEAGVKTSMGTVGDCYDNALCESFLATLECEFLWRGKFMDHAEARREVFRFIEGWYNRRRHHSGLGYMSPVEFEKSTGKRKRGFPKSTQPEGPQSGWRKRGYDVRSAKLTYVLAHQMINHPRNRGNYNIHVNAIGPGHFRTEMTEPLFRDREWVKELLARIPSGRAGVPEDLAGAVIFLAPGGLRLHHGPDHLCERWFPRRLARPCWLISECGLYNKTG